VAPVPETPAPQVGNPVPRCSAKGCRAAAGWDLRWRNPRLHDSARVKVWLACEDHREQLAAFLSDRGFLLGVDSR
jgi:hypothetical protein